MVTESQQSAGENFSQAATKIARQNISNIVAKLRAGRTLSISEQKAMEKWEAELGDGEWVKDTSALAKELGLNRRAIYDARAKYPNEAPKREPGSRRENLVAWQRFCAEKLIGKDVATQTLADLKAQLMQREIKLRDMKIARESGAMIASEIVDEMLGTLAQKLDLLLRLKLEVELGPRVAGKTAAEANLEGRTILDEIRDVVNANIATFQNEAIKQTIKQDDDEDGTDRDS
jgi:hypothetical protein